MSGRHVTEVVVEQLRQGGAPKDLIAFADRHVERFSQAELDKARWHGFAFALLIVFSGGALALLFHWLGIS